MPDELTPGAAGQGGTNEAAAAGDNGFDFQRAYSELHPEFTRRSQRLSEYESLFEAIHSPDPEVQAEAAAALGLEMDTGSEEPDPARTDEEWVDPLEEEVKELRAWREEVQADRELEASNREQEDLDNLRDRMIGEEISTIEEFLKPQYGDNFKFKESEEEALGNLAIALGENDVPDVRAAYKLLYEDVLEANRERWYATKTGAATPPAGTSIPAEQKPKTARERAQYIDERVANLDRQQ